MGTTTGALSQVLFGQGRRGDEDRMTFRDSVDQQVHVLVKVDPSARDLD